jgi:hypothetical protein
MVRNVMKSRRKLAAKLANALPTVATARGAMVLDLLLTASDCTST